MTTRHDYRINLENKFLALEDSGYGDFNFEDLQLNFFLSMAVSQLYPAVYQRKKASNLLLVTYGSNNLTFLPSPVPDVTTVFRIEDTAERQDMLGWRISGPDIIDIDPWQSSGSNGATVVTNVDVHYHAPYFLDWTLDTNVDAVDIGIPSQFDPMVYIAATIEALESRQDTGVRGDPPPIGQMQEVSLLDRLQNRLKIMKTEMHMSLPAIRM